MAFGRDFKAQRDFGLLIAGKNTQVPLKAVTVKAQLKGYLVGLNSTLKYSNDSASPMEVVFRFPIDESYAVVGLEARIGGRRIKAEVREKEEAKQMYDDAMASGFTAALAEEKSGDIFSITLGNLPPQSEAELQLLLAGELGVDAEGAVRFSLPAVLKPRYTPSGSTDPLKPIGLEPASNVAHGSAPAVFKFEMEVADEKLISSVTSPTHTITTQTKSGDIHITLSDGTPLDKDLVVLVHQKEPHSPKAIPELGDRKQSQKKLMGSPAVMLNFFPKFETKRAACEFVFIVDRSGSMGGSFIRSASETLVLFLKSIPPGCSFNIIGFGSRYTSLFPSSVPYNQENLDVAIKHAETLQADLGGTELLSPLKHVFSQPLLPGLPRQVFVLTDGSVSNTNACIQEVRKNIRVFTFGIGSGASTALVKGLAKTGNGTAEFIKEGERLQPKVISSLKRALQPSVTDLEVQFDMTSGFDALEAPDKLPTVFNGDKVVIYGIFRSKAASDAPLDAGVSGAATLKGKILGVSFEHTIPFNVPSSSESPDDDSFTMPIVHHLASKSLIRDWEHKEGWASTVSESECKKEIIRVSIESSVVSSHTAYIAVDEDQDKPIEGAIQTWDVTATMAAQEGGWGLFGGGWLGGSRSRGMMFGGPPPPGAPMPMAFTGGGNFMYGLSSNGLFDGLPSPPPPTGGGFGGFASGPPPPPPTGGGFGGFASGLPPPPPTGGGFGGFASGPPPPPPTGGGFASGPPPPAPAGGGFGFSSQPRSHRQNQASYAAPRMLAAGPPPPLLCRDASNIPSRGGSMGGSVMSRSAASRSSNELTQLISLQQADGFWKLDSVTNFTNKSLSNPISGVDPNVWATVLALVLLESRFSEQEDEWELVAMKAETWLSMQTLPVGVDVATLKQEAKKLV